MKPSRSEACGEAQGRLGAAPRRSRRRLPPSQRPSAGRGCRRPARPRRGAGRRRPSGSPSARASRAPARPRRASARPTSAAWARNSSGWPLDERGQPDARARVERGARSPPGDVEVVGVRVVRRRRVTSLQWSAQRRLELLLGGDQRARCRRRPGRAARGSARPAAARRCRGAPRVPPRKRRGGGDLGELAVLERQLGGGRDLDLLGVAERALGEGREPAQRLDLDVEHVDPDGALLGRAGRVEQAAADRELPALLDLVDALVARRRRASSAHSSRSSSSPTAQREGARAQRRVGDLLRQRDRRRSPAPRRAPRAGAGRRRGRPADGASGQRVKRGDAQADQVRRRREVGLVGDAARGVEADACAAPATRAGRRRGRAAARSSPTTTSVGRCCVCVQQGGDQERAQRRRTEGVDRRLARARGPPRSRRGGRAAGRAASPRLRPGRGARRVTRAALAGEDRLGCVGRPRDQLGNLRGGSAKRPST